MQGWFVWENCLHACLRACCFWCASQLHRACFQSQWRTFSDKVCAARAMLCWHITAGQVVTCCPGKLGIHPWKSPCHCVYPREPDHFRAINEGRCTAGPDKEDSLLLRRTRSPLTPTVWEGPPTPCLKAVAWAPSLAKDRTEMAAICLAACICAGAWGHAWDRGDLCLLGCVVGGKGRRSYLHALLRLSLHACMNTYKNREHWNCVPGLQLYPCI